MTVLHCNFYPRSPCGERQPGESHASNQQEISIHALLAESDGDVVYNWLPYAISIHALLAESDHSRRSRKQRHPHFYPRSPCGERHKPTQRAEWRQKFLSTLSLRRATTFGSLTARSHPSFLSTLSLRRATRGREEVVSRMLKFLSTLSLRRATTSSVNTSVSGSTFLSTLSLRRAT